MRDRSFVCAIALVFGGCAPVVNSNDASVQSDVLADGESVDVAAPPERRQLAPLSSATVTTQRPTLHWVLGAGTDGVHVDLCRDRDLTAGCEAFEATGTSAVPLSTLAPGIWFWRLSDRLGTMTGTMPSPVWQFS